MQLNKLTISSIKVLTGLVLFLLVTFDANAQIDQSPPIDSTTAKQQIDTLGPDSSTTVSQTDTTSTAKDSTDAEKVDPKLSELEEKIAELQKELDATEQSDTVGLFELKGKSAVDANGKEITISNLEILIRNQSISEIRIRTDENALYESTKQLPLHRYNAKAPNYEIGLVQSSGTTNKDVLYLTDILMFTENLKLPGYFPIEDYIYLDPDSVTAAHMERRTDLNSYLDVRVYTDLLGLLGNGGNGLVQTEVRSRFKNYGLPVLKNLFWFSYLEPSFKLQKFDSEYSYQDVEYTDTTQSSVKIDKLKFNQWSYINLGMKLNILHLGTNVIRWDILDVGLQYDYSDIKLPGDSNKTTINASSLTAESSIQILNLQNFGVDFGMKAQWQNILNTEIDGHHTSDFYLTSKASIFYYPKGKESSMFFVRFQEVAYLQDIEHYSLLQFGYKSKLNFSDFKKK